MEGNKKYCDFCGKYIPDDDMEQIYFVIDDVIRNYCSECACHAEEVRKGVERKINYFKSNGMYYEIEHVFKVIESLYKNGNGNMKISFKNIFGYDGFIIGTPIIKDGVPVGYITDVNEKDITGLIWEKYMPIITNLVEKQVTSFEIVY